MQSLLEALKLQTRYSHLGPGLIRLTLEHNNPSKSVSGLWAGLKNAAGMHYINTKCGAEPKY